jgi:hypothetical protein
MDGNGKVGDNRLGCERHCAGRVLETVARGAELDVVAKEEADEYYLVAVGKYFAYISVVLVNLFCLAFIVLINYCNKGEYSSIKSRSNDSVISNQCCFNGHKHNLTTYYHNLHVR